MMAGSPATGPLPPSPAEITGASRIKWGALLGLLGLAMGIGGVLIVIIDVGVGFSNISNSGFQSLLDTILLAVVVIVAGVVVALLSFVLYVAAFASLRQEDDRFRTPMVLGIIGLIGLLCIAGFVGSYAASIDSALGCAASDTACQNNATSLAGGIVGLGYLGALLGFIGLIGTIIGLYRFGSRYESGITKVGAILYIIPFASLLAPLLVLIGAHQVHRRLRQGAQGPPAMTSYSPMPPPPGS